MKERWLFWTMVALLLIPVWSVLYIPTLDGPSHIYNAWILRQYGNTEEYPLFQQYYEIDWRPIPNWLSHAVLTLLMFPFAPLTAEKILLSGYVVLLAGAARYLARSTDRPWLAWLALPLVYNQLLHLGFYNFCLSVGFCLLAVGTWWRHRDRPGPGLAVKLNLLLLLCWFSHIVSLVIALAAIGVLWLITLRGRPLGRHLWHVLILAPQVILPLWFVQAQGGEVIPAETSPRIVWLFLLSFRVLYMFGREQTWIGIAVAVLFFGLLALTLAGKRRKEWREEDGFLLLGLLAAVLYFVSPDGMAGGILLKNRLSLYPWLLMLPALAPRLGGRGRTAVIAAAGLVTVFQIGMLVHWYRLLQPEIREFVASAAPIEPDSRVLPLLFKRTNRALPVGMLSHAFSYVSVEKGLVDWANYEAMTGHFPVRFRPEAGLSDIYALEAHTDQVNIRAYKGRTDFVFTWRMPPGARMNRVLGKHFKLLAENGPAHVYRRRGRSSLNQ